MIFASVSCQNFTATYHVCLGARLVNSVLNVKGLVGAFKQELAQVEDFCVIVKSSRTFVSSFSKYITSDPRQI